MNFKAGAAITFLLPAGALALAMVLFSTCQQGGGRNPAPGRGSSDATGLAGNWTSGCLPDIGKKGFYFLDTRSFEGSIFRTTFTSFSDAKCTTKIMAQVQTGSYKIGEPAGSANAIDLTIGSIMITLHTESLTQSYNDRKFCGGGWEVSVEKAITKEMCMQNADPDADPDMIYEIFQVKDGKLYFGTKDESDDGKTEDTRPAVTDMNRAYTKA
jgi:hypothetical protein